MNLVLELLERRNWNKTRKKTKNIGQCSVYYKSRSYKDGKKCTWDVGLHAFKRIILDRF